MRKYRVPKRTNGCDYWLTMLPRGRNVLIRFQTERLGRCSVHVQERDPDNPETRVSLRTRLIGVDWARVDGTVVQTERQKAA